MKLFEALALRKALQSQLAQLISLRNSTFENPEDEKPEFDFQELTNRIKQKVREITGLKIALMRANMNSNLPNGYTLYKVECFRRRGILPVAVLGQVAISRRLLVVVSSWG